MIVYRVILLAKADWESCICMARELKRYVQLVCFSLSEQKAQDEI